MNETIDNIKKVKGEMLIYFKADDSSLFKHYTFKFSSSKENGHKLVIKAKNISFEKQDSKLTNMFKVVESDQIIGKKLLEYEDWHAEVLTDTGNITAPQNNITLTFEEGYVIEIENFE